SQALASNQLLAFRFISRDTGVEGAHFGLAEPVATSRTEAVLLAVREKNFSPAENYAFNLLSSLARLALDNAELATLYSTQQQNLGEQKKRAEDLMEMSLDLGSALRLPDFVKNFTERVAEMIRAKRAVLGLAQGNLVECVGFYGVKPER